MVSGEKGWFPYGTDCSRGIGRRDAYCIKVSMWIEWKWLMFENVNFIMSCLYIPSLFIGISCIQYYYNLNWNLIDVSQGRCLEFGPDGTPLYVPFTTDHESHHLFKRSLIFNTTGKELLIRNWTKSEREVSFSVLHIRAK